MTASKKNLLTTLALTVGYGNGASYHILFRELDLELCAGQLVCFMGPNGAGKSSLIRTLAGLQKPLSGEVKLHTLDKLPRQVSVVLTDKPIIANMTARDVVTYGRYPYLNWNLSLGISDIEMITTSMRRVGVENLSGKNISELSDGQLQMVMIARALAQDTPVILLDEPTAHLDLNNRVEIMKLLRKLAREMKKAILVAAHELDLALQTADVIWLTGKGKNIEVGLPEDLVLDGSFDRIFEFKGYDLKTGKVHHDPHRGKTIQLSGEGFYFLWTKNALERSGFTITQDHAELNVVIKIEETKPRWILRKNNQLYSVNSIAALVEHI